MSRMWSSRVRRGSSRGVGEWFLHADAFEAPVQLLPFKAHVNGGSGNNCNNFLSRFVNEWEGDAIKRGPPGWGEGGGGGAE